MKENELSINNLHKLLDDDIVQLMEAERRLRNVMPDWINKASVLTLKSVLQKYADLINRHVGQLERYCQDMEVSIVPQMNRVMQSYLDSTAVKLSRCVDIEVRDAALLADVQLINHYKICMYGTTAAFAQALEMTTYESILRELEINEKQIDDRLSQLASFEINPRAKAPVVLPG